MPPVAAGPPAPRSTFEIRLAIPGHPDQVWKRLWDLRRHTAAVPFTVVSGGPLGPGVQFVGRTGLGPLQVDDVMTVREWEPPRRCVVEKIGSPLRGRIEATLHPLGGGRTLLRWRQSYAVRRLPDRLTCLTRPLVRAGYAVALRRITRAD